MASDSRIGVLFVCMGNICRSPAAEGVFRHKISVRNVADRFHVDSAGTGGWHVGDQADHRMRRVAESHGFTLTSRARQVRREDFTEFDWLICMDNDNREHLLQLGAPAEKTVLLLGFDPDLNQTEVPDPYYGGESGFELVISLVDRACDAMLDQMLSATT